MSDGRKRTRVPARRTPAFDAAVIAPHHGYPDALRADGRLELAGPFPDRSGGAYPVRAASPGKAEAIAFAGPAHTRGHLDVTVHEWNAAP